MSTSSGSSLRDERLYDSPLIVFLAGSGRSGSTLLGDALAEIPGCVHVGEIRFLLADLAWHERVCGCGLTLGDCPRWNKVLSVAFDNHMNNAELRQVAGFSREAMRYRPRALRELRRQAERSEPISHGATLYAKALSRLYAAVAEIAGARVIVDSSKIAMHVYLGSRCVARRSHVVHLVRDVRAIAYSWRRSSIDGVTFGPARTSASWVISNMAAASLHRRLGPASCTLVRYEDFIRAPRETLRSITEAIGMPEAPLPVTDGSTLRLGSSHTVAGNPSRFKDGVIELVPDEEWRTAISPRDRLLATLPGAFALKRYDYPLLWRD
jgi:hypothetical protein